MSREEKWSGLPPHFPIALETPPPPRLDCVILFPKPQLNRCLLSDWKETGFLREHGNQTVCPIHQMYLSPSAFDSLFNLIQIQA